MDFSQPIADSGHRRNKREAQNAGIDSREVEEALGYEHSAKKDHYTPQIPLSFQLQRAGLPWAAEKRALVDAVQFRVLREKAAVVFELVNLAVPALPTPPILVIPIPY